ncbi:phospholipid scramblase 2-like [Eurytemora carolleeae]|uniref:phospholipid scramblase 2-like n=1 Tax=Eurytemora carolleeae TaxID=1294199 RepID=UPI000C7685FC|nr:phospholipid scramblase 2-like [Eurytemora carolleeae]XP_023337810.1 phospholipid scramblase 2-like [Eurytemora carolleeae]XP_023337811.1 phospholipid scramblase 2-like [Eurytemora carolleeae]XP_023337812.1 phospholipid scramblase 2-like [Eurytemora carolleeae]XP_023337813.1 phospholipid scramblase 2-like [Eurytemora carolleeae]XP_023337814.1 phospholipid scramblase 2-like [Eurytemora carolleeae]XP_023337815.1 phospholipid scramblase 2-like [Eurytemora carolleeae]XP_023337816.1 phospholip|eukprot:XP_023337809.1 phospholipid scramblase 2-like [Eurytemora affinis]
MMQSLQPITDEPRGIELDEIDITGGRVLTGLGPLRDVDSIIIKQKISTCELLTGCEMENRFLICGPQGDTLFWAKEHSNFCNRLWCGSVRSFNMSITDQTNQTVMEINRALACQGLCCSFLYPYCTQELNVSVGSQSVGTIRERATWWSPVLHIFDSVGNQVLKVRGPNCLFFCCDDINFSVLNTDGAEVGSITKKWMGCWKETLTDADNFLLTFNPGMDVSEKVLIIAATFLIDVMFFEYN